MSRFPRLLSPLAALLLGLPLAGCAGASSLVELQVLDAGSGQALPQWPYRGRDYIAGDPGQRFALSLRNLGGERVLAVVSVDGVNAISGQTAASSQAGYVLEPWQRIEVRGWRKSHAEVAEFYFTDLPDSYAARTGRPDNVGVIGLAAFRERRIAPVYAPPPVAVAPGYERYGQAGKASANAADAAAPRASRDYAAAESAAAPSVQRQQLGTGHGDRRYDPVSQTRFERASRWPEQTVVIHYDAWQALAERGIVPREHRDGAPQPFPLGFVPDPR